MNFQIICIIFTLFISLNSKGSESNRTKENHRTVPNKALSWKAKVHLINFNPSQEKKIRTAITVIKKIISTAEFKERILNYQYKGKKAFVDNKGLSNEEIYQKILEGAEERDVIKKNNTMDVELELYFQATKTIGYTYPDTNRIWINEKYFTQYTPAKVADNLMHEWMHKLGFGHSSKWSEDREHSVPYAIGYLIEELAKKL